MPEPFNFLEDLTDKQVSQKEKEFYDTHKDLKLTETPFKTQYGRKVYEDQYGQKHSESSRTIQDSQGRWMNVPSIYNGEYVNNKLAKENVFVISHKGDTLLDKFPSILKFEKYKNFTRMA